MPPRPRYFNLEVTGSASCLASVVAALKDSDIGLAKTPVWHGHIGTMEVGPIAAARFSAVDRFVASARCVAQVRRRPCATPYSDVKVC